ncbi:MAG TPA: ABC transporter substrate binding protein [Vicinamibacterales bacterium]|nr:ABC transporter substrate binding protein [Vicinamibacterales bacterium]
MTAIAPPAPAPPALPRRKPFTAIRKGLIEHVLAGRLRGAAFAVYIWLHLQADHRTGVVRTNAARLAQELGFHAVTVRRALVDLRTMGYLSYDGAGAGPALYEIRIEKYHAHFESSASARPERQGALHTCAPSARQRASKSTSKKKEVDNDNTSPAGKAIELLKEAVPRAARIVILFNAKNHFNLPYLQEAKRSATRLGLAVDTVEASDADTLEERLNELSRRRPDAVVVPTDPFLNAQRVRIVAGLNRAALPAIFGFREFVQAGGLISYDSNFARHVQARGALRRQESPGGESRRPADRAADPFRAGDQRQDRQGARTHVTAIAAAEG